MRWTQLITIGQNCFKTSFLIDIMVTWWTPTTTYVFCSPISEPVFSTNSQQKNIQISFHIILINIKNSTLLCPVCSEATLIILEIQGIKSALAAGKVTNAKGFSSYQLLDIEEKEHLNNFVSICFFFHLWPNLKFIDGAKAN